MFLEMALSNGFLMEILMPWKSENGLENAKNYLLTFSQQWWFYGENAIKILSILYGTKAITEDRVT